MTYYDRGHAQSIDENWIKSLARDHDEVYQDNNGIWHIYYLLEPPEHLQYGPGDTEEQEPRAQGTGAPYPTK